MLQRIHARIPGKKTLWVKTEQVKLMFSLTTITIKIRIKTYNKGNKFNMLISILKFKLFNSINRYNLLSIP